MDTKRHDSVFAGRNADAAVLGSFDVKGFRVHEILDENSYDFHAAMRRPVTLGKLLEFVEQQHVAEHFRYEATADVLSHVIENRLVEGDPV